MINFSIFKNLKEDYNMSKRTLRNKFGLTINQKTNFINIRETYSLCLKQAKRYSASTCLNFLYSSSLFTDFNNPVDNEIENDVFFHCLVSALYTAQYLLLSPKNVTLAKVGKFLKNSGFLSLRESKTLNSRYLICKYLRNGSAVTQYTYHSNESRRTAFTKKVSTLSNRPFFSDYIDIFTDDKKSYFTTLFSTNLTYALIEYNRLHQPLSLINSINSSSPRSRYYERVRHFVDNYSINYNSLLNSNLLDQKRYSNASEIPQSLKCKIVDNILFEYQIERIFNFNIVAELFTPRTIKSDIIPALWDNDMLACLSLPNVYSRHKYINMAINNEDLFSIKELVNWLTSTTFPIFENIFFILLYDYFLSLYGDIEKALSSIINEIYNFLISDVDLINEYSGFYIIKYKNSSSIITDNLSSEYSYEIFMRLMDLVFVNYKSTQYQCSFSRDVDYILEILNTNLWLNH